MPQQYEQSEEEFRDGPRPQRYQAGYTDENMPGHKLLDHKPDANRSADVGTRLGLAIVSMSFVFVLFIIAMGLGVSFATIFFTLLFTVIMVLFNITFSLSLRR